LSTFACLLIKDMNLNKHRADNFASAEAFFKMQV